METNKYKTDNIFPVTEEEILREYDHVFNNDFQTRTIQSGAVWNLWTNSTHYNWFSDGYTKGHSTSAILINKDGEKDYVEFWKQWKDNKVQYCYSFKRRSMFNEILK
jgi:hypothetical protein